MPEVTKRDTACVWRYVNFELHDHGQVLAEKPENERNLLNFISTFYLSEGRFSHFVLLSSALVGKLLDLFSFLHRKLLTLLFKVHSGDLCYDWMLYKKDGIVN